MWNAGEHPLEQVRKQQPNIQTHPSEQWPSDGLEPADTIGPLSTLQCRYAQISIKVGQA